MPIYEYRCGDCEQVFEAIQRISDEPLDACRHCSGAAHRIVSSPAIQFLGSGWYVTDYARKAGEKGANGKNGSAAKDGAPGKPDSGNKDSGNKAGKENAGQQAGAASGAKPSSSGSESRAGSPS